MIGTNGSTVGCSFFFMQEHPQKDLTMVNGHACRSC